MNQSGSRKTTATSVPTSARQQSGSAFAGHGLAATLGPAARAQASRARYRRHSGHEHPLGRPGTSSARAESSGVAAEPLLAAHAPRRPPSASTPAAASAGTSRGAANPAVAQAAPATLCLEARHDLARSGCGRSAPPRPEAARAGASGMRRRKRYGSSAHGAQLNRSARAKIGRRRRFELGDDLVDRLAEVHAVLEDPLARVLDLGPGRDRRHAADVLDPVEEDARVRRLRVRVEERVRLGDRLAATAPCGRSRRRPARPPARARTRRTATPRPSRPTPSSCSRRPSGGCPAGSSKTGSETTSQSNFAASRNVGHRAPGREQHRQPAVDEAALVVLGLDLGVGRDDAVDRRAARRRASAPPCASAVSNVNRVGFSSSSTTSPPFDQMNGASRMIVGSTPRP